MTLPETTHTHTETAWKLCSYFKSIVLFPICKYFVLQEVLSLWLTHPGSDALKQLTVKSVLGLSWRKATPTHLDVSGFLTCLMDNEKSLQILWYFFLWMPYLNLGSALSLLRESLLIPKDLSQDLLPCLRKWDINYGFFHSHRIVKDLLNSIMACFFHFCLPETLEELSWLRNHWPLA